MKKLLSPFIFFFCLQLIAQESSEIAIKTNICEATVFLNGAQVVRKKSVDVVAGKSVLKFVDLSPYIDAKSVKVKVDGQVMVLSVNHQFNYVDSASRSNELKDLDSKISVIDDRLQVENASLAIINEESAFLRDNRIIGGKNQEMSLTNFKETSNFYKEKMTSLKMSEIETSKTIAKLNDQRQALSSQRNQISSNKPTVVSEVLVKVDTKVATKCDVELSYFVNNAGWFPSYDIRANSIDVPIELVYKANIHQSTKEDWKNIKLKLSSSDPKTGSIAPQLQTYYLNYNTRAPKYNSKSNQIFGRVIDSSTNDGIPGVSITVQGTTIGTISDIDGNYSISIPNNNCQLQYSFIGYNEQVLPISGSNMNAYLSPQISELEEVVVVGYGVQKDKKSVSRALQGKVLGVSTISDSKKFSSLSIPVAQSETTTAFEFDINTPYTINSTNKTFTVDMESYVLDASFEYYSVPKVDKDAFLVANITNWEKLNLLDGEANIFFENTFVGKSILDTRYLNDTLNISLGRDKNVFVKREKQKDLTTKQFIGSKKEETRVWQISVKNNKKSPIILTLFDQVPVSTLEEIEVTIDNISGAELNKDKGEVKWKLNLDPSTKKDFELKYRVKYPKDRNLVIE